MHNLQGAGDIAGRTKFVYDGRLGELYVIFIKNVLLSIITLGIYRFWGKTRIRRYLWSHTSLFGDRFEYTGTGKELFLGFLIALALLAVAVGLVVGLAFGLGMVSENLGAVAIIVAYAGVFLLFFVARFTALRYRLSRTRWRGIRGGLAGSPWRFALISIGWNLLNMVAAGLLSPVVAVQTLGYRIRNAYFGTARASFTATPGDLYGRYLAFYFGSIVVGLVGIAVVGAIFYSVGIIGEIGDIIESTQDGQTPSPRLQILILFAIYGAMLLVGLLILPLVCWYSSFYYNYLIGHTGIAGVRFSSGFATWGMFGYLIGNLLILLLTLGIGFPWVLHRVMRFIVTNVVVEGEIDPETVRQSQLASPATGEGLFELLDTGVI